MTKEEKSRYSEPEALRDILKRVLSGRKFLLDCGHHVSFGSQLGKRHHHSQRQRAENHLLALRALKSKEVFYVVIMTDLIGRTLPWPGLWLRRWPRRRKNVNESEE